MIFMAVHSLAMYTFNLVLTLAIISISVSNKFAVCMAILCIEGIKTWQILTVLPKFNPHTKIGDLKSNTCFFNYNLKLVTT